MNILFGENATTALLLTYKQLLKKLIIYRSYAKTFLAIKKLKMLLEVCFVNS